MTSTNQKPFIIYMMSFLILFCLLFLFSFRFVLAQENETPTSTPESIITPSLEPEPSPEPSETPEPTPSAESSPESSVSLEPTTNPSSEPEPEPSSKNFPEPSQTPEPTPSAEPSPEPNPEPTHSPEPSFETSPEPVAPEPTVQPVVPFVSENGRAFDPAIAPSKVKIKILDPEGNVPKTPVFISYIGVGGRTYGGQINREGIVETIMPTGRYETDFLVIDTKLGPPANRPSFFLEANEDRDLGVFLLTNQSSFQDEELEKEMADTLGANTVGTENRGALAKIFALIVKLLLAILNEIRSLRSDMMIH